MATRKFGLRLRFLMVCGVVLVSLLLASSVLAALPIDTTIAEFNTGTVGSCYVGPTTADGVNGEVTLLPTLATDFSGGSLPTGWTVQTWQSGGGVTFVAGGMIVNNAVTYGPVVNAPASIEYMAVVANDLNQNTGFANLTTFDFATPWAFFSSWDAAPVKLWARTFAAAGTNTDLGASYINTAQRYQIRWTATDVTYLINDVQVDMQSAAITSMPPMMSENGGSTLDVDWLRMGPYAPTTCTYESHLFDSGIVNPTWTTLSTSTYIPANTTLSFETRSGDTTNAGDATWSGWQLVSGNAIASPTRRYLQYRAVLATTDSLATPRVYSVQPQGTTPTAIQLSSISGRSTATPVIWLLAFVAGLTVIVLGYQMRRTSRSRR